MVKKDKFIFSVVFQKKTRNFFKILFSAVHTCTIVVLIAVLILFSKGIAEADTEFIPSVCENMMEPMSAFSQLYCTHTHTHTPLNLICEIVPNIYLGVF